MKGLRYIVGWAIGLAVLSGCSTKGEKKPPREVVLDAMLTSQASRVQIVAQADKIALMAHGASGERSADLFAQAAELRESSFRVYGKRVDALEALELWSEASGASSVSGCDHALRLVSLKGRVEPQPEDQYRQYYLLRERFQEPTCRSRIEKALTVLSRHEPTADILRQWRKNAENERAAHGGPAHVQHDSLSREVVVPEILRASLENPTKITEVEPFGAERTARVVVNVTHPTKFQVGVIEKTKDRGPRLFVDIEHATYDGPEVLQSTGLIERVRLGQKKDHTRVVLDLTEPVHHRVFYLPEPFRLIIDLSVEPPESAASPRQIQRVVLDPGHGGHDPGAVGPNGLREKDVALDIAHRAAPLLAREVGVSTLLTRDVDAYVPLDERAARANAFHADLFISVHLNSSEDTATKGVMTFVLDTSRDAAASKIAARENASTEAAAAELANSLSRIESADRRAASQTFAQLLQRSAGVSLRQRYDDVEDQGVRRAGFYVLAGAAMPAVLFEGSFISNPIEAQRLNSEDYRQRLADAIVNAVRAYREGL